MAICVIKCGSSDSNGSIYDPRKNASKNFPCASRRSRPSFVDVGGHGVASLAGCESKRGAWRHFDFIEVGASDYNTICQFVNGNKSSCPMGYALRTWDVAKVHGLVVEPVTHLLRRLPKLPGVLKVDDVALGSKDGSGVFNYVREDAAKRFPKSYAVYLARGTGNVGSPHPQLSECLRQEGIKYADVMTSKPVHVWSFATLAKRYRVASVDVLKLDCEGRDCDVLQGLIDYCRKGFMCFPRIISFETNSLCSEPIVNNVLQQLEGVGYRVLWRGRDTVLKLEVGIPAVCGDFLCGWCGKGQQCFFDHVSVGTPWGAHGIERCYGKSCLCCRGYSRKSDYDKHWSKMMQQYWYAGVDVDTTSHGASWTRGSSCYGEDHWHTWNYDHMWALGSTRG